MDRQTFPTKIIHDSQRPEAAPIKQILRYKIYTSALSDVRQGLILLTVCCTDIPEGVIPAHIQTFQTVNPVVFL